MAHHDIGRRLEAVDQEADFLVYAQIERPYDCAHPLAPQPVFSGAEQRLEYRSVIGGLDQAEKSGLSIMPFKIQIIYLGRYASDRYSIAPCHPGFPAGMPEPGIFFRQGFLALDFQRRHPIRVIPV